MSQSKDPFKIGEVISVETPRSDRIDANYYVILKKTHRMGGLFKRYTCLLYTSPSPRDS